MDYQTFPFRFDTAHRLPAALFGVNDRTAAVTVGDHGLDVRFGPWRVVTELTNVTGVTVTGPYGLLRTAGPARLSVADRGLTFATNGERGLCIRFRDPVSGIEPTGHLRHPGLTVTVADVDALTRVLGAVTVAA